MDPVSLKLRMQKKLLEDIVIIESFLILKKKKSKDAMTLIKLPNSKGFVENKIYPIRHSFSQISVKCNSGYIAGE